MGPGPGRAMRQATKVILSITLVLALLAALTRFALSLLDEPTAFPGYTVVAPMSSTRTYLIDMKGRAVKTWESAYTAGQVAYLLENGHLLRAGQLRRDER